MSRPHVSPYLAVWTVISLRPTSQQAAMRRAIAARGATPLALPALRLAPMPDPAGAAGALQAALRCTRVLFTSPAAVRHAARLAPLRVAAGSLVFAVGSGTAAALARHALAARQPAPGVMHSEGLLALPELSAEAIRGRRIGLVTAPGGRGVIARTLLERGAALQIAEVYRRLPPRFDRRHERALLDSTAPRALLLTSAEAFDHVLESFRGEALARLRDALVVASSARLAALAHARGFERVVEANAPTAAALLDALHAHAARAGTG